MKKKSLSMANSNNSSNKNSSYLGNTKVKGSGDVIQWTEEMVKEWLKCKEDPIYFCEKYMKIVHVDKGLIPIEFRDYQKELVMSMVDNRYTMACMCRQSGKTTTYVAFCLWYILFNEFKLIGLLANKGGTARQILGRIQLAYENLPKWLQQGVVEYNKGSFELENGCKIIACSTSSSTARGYSFSVAIIDETAFVERWNEFSNSVMPTITSGQETKLILVSTPNGLNHFYKFYIDAIEGRNNYNLIECIWKDVPGRDEKWKEETISYMGGDRDKFAQEFENQFLGSSGTLIAGWKLKELVHQRPLVSRNGFDQFEVPEEGNTYVLISDVARGKGLDYSAIQIIDVTSMPYNQVAVFHSNMITPVNLTEVIYNMATAYNDAFVLVEINDIGAEVTDLLHFEYEYENLVFTETAGRAGKKVTGGFGKNVDMGIRTTKTVKNTGCSVFKMLIEQNQLRIHHFPTIHEISTFIQKGKSYQAEEGKHDDLVMCLVLFSWLSNQSFFKDLTEIHTLNQLRDKAEEMMEDLLPFGIIDNGVDHNRENQFIDSDGTVWSSSGVKLE